MTQQLDRLEALLERVQNNRAAGSRASNPGTVAKTMPGSVARVEVPEPPFAPPAPAPVAASPAPPARPKPAPTPLEMALEGRVSQPMPAPAAPAPPAARKPEPLPAPPAFVQTPQRPEMATAPAPAPNRAKTAGPVEEFVLSDPPPPEPSKPIIQVVSKQPPAATPTFGDLLKRSLSLRPR